MITTNLNAIYRIHSKAISCNKQFCISSDDNMETSTQILFQAPSCSMITREINSIGAFIHFTIKKTDQEALDKAGLEIHHIAEYIQNLSSKNFSYDGSQLYVYIIGNSALFIVKRITDYLFTRVFNYETAEDLLYYIQACFNSLKLDKSLDKLILCGEIEPDSKIARLISIYFINLATESSLPLSFLAS